MTLCYFVHQTVERPYNILIFSSCKLKQVQAKVVAMLSARLRENDDTFSVAHLLHSLGNTGSDLAVDVLLDYLQAKDLDVQLAAISSLRMHISSEKVQIALTHLLEVNKMEEVGLTCCLPRFIHFLLHCAWLHND